jgi:hypothetical protein
MILRNRAAKVVRGRLKFFAGSLPSTAELAMFKSTNAIARACARQCAFFAQSWGIRPQIGQWRGLPAGCREPSMVEAGGQFIRSFRCGLDYAFILQTNFGLQDAERVMPRLHRDILVPAQKHRASSASL